MATAWYSPDGRAWERAGTGQELRSITVFGDRLIAVGNDGHLQSGPPALQAVWIGR